MYPRLESERGVALIMALGAIVIIGVLMGSVLFVSTQDYRVGSNTVRSTRAAAAAELGLNRVLSEWTLATNQIPAGSTFTRIYTAPGGARDSVIVTRLPGPFFWAVSQGYAGGQGSQASARRRYGTLFRLNLPNMNILGAVTTQGNTTIKGNVTVNGNDVAPAGWASCGPAAPAVAGAAISPTTTANVQGSVVINGNPPSLTTPAASDTNTYFNYGNSNYQALAATATYTYPAGTQLTSVAPIAAGGVCTVSANPPNWGDVNRATPAGACETFFPIIHVLGDLKVTGGSGQGVLLVDGSVTLAGNFVWDGAIIARGALKMSGTGTVNGAMMAATVTVGDSTTTITGNTTLQYSSCALMSALSANSYPTQAPRRGWVDLF